MAAAQVDKIKPILRRTPSLVVGYLPSRPFQLAHRRETASEQSTAASGPALPGPPAFPDYLTLPLL